MNEIKQELYDRFIKYVSIDTTSDPTQKTRFCYRHHCR